MNKSSLTIDQCKDFVLILREKQSEAANQAKKAFFSYDAGKFEGKVEAYKEIQTLIETMLKSKT